MLLFFAVCFSLFLCQQSSLAHTVSMSALKISKWQSSHCSKIFSGLSSSPSNVIFTLCPMCFCRAFHKSISRSIISLPFCQATAFLFRIAPGLYSRPSLKYEKRTHQRPLWFLLFNFRTTLLHQGSAPATFSSRLPAWAGSSTSLRLRMMCQCSRRQS